MLMRNFGGEELEGLPDKRWAAAAALFAVIQIEEADRLERWLEMGCPRRGLTEMLALWEEILTDRDFRS